jgi:hypothetical protein
MLRPFSSCWRGHAVLVAVVFSLIAPRAAGSAPATSTVDLAGQVSDSTTAQPVSGADVALVLGGQLVAHTTSDGSGRFLFHAIPAGTYLLQATLVGYRPARASVTLGDQTTARADLQLVAAPIEMQVVQVGAKAPMAVDTRSGDQLFEQTNYHGAPTTTASQILQQSMAGAVRAPTGEVHIRGQHAEYTYYIDGVPVVTGISGGLNELFDPEVASQIRFQTGGWDAEYGNKNAAIVYVTSKVPTGQFHLTASGSGGSFGTNDQKLSLSSRSGKLGFFVSGSRQETDMRQEPVMADPATTEAINFHNHGEDLFGFGKVQWLPSLRDFVNLDLNLSSTKLEVPYDSTGGVVLDDNQKEINGFANASWQHDFGSSSSPRASLLAAFFQRHGSLDYLPGANDTPPFVFYPYPEPFNLEEHRSFNTSGVKLDYTFHPSHDIEWKGGMQGSVTTGHENFSTLDARGNPGPGSDSDLNGHDVGGYAQAVWLPTEQIEIRPGVRYDSHHAPFAGTSDQVSPRFKVSWLASTATTAWVYYGRMFIPTNIEDLRAITSVADSGVVAEPTVPERDHFYEIGVVHRFPQGVVAKLSGYHKRSSPGIDDNTVPGSAIVTSVNIAEVRITGIEAAIEAHPPGPISGYVNAALNHAWGHGPITGGFFPVDNPPGNFDLDHDQRVSVVASLTASQRGGFLSATAIYGSGLTNGADPDASYGTGLFDFNRSIHVDPNTIVNASGGYAFAAGKVTVRPQLFVDNLFDQKYLLKGAFFSGASVGRPRSVQAKVEISL